MRATVVRARGNLTVRSRVPTIANTTRRTAVSVVVAILGALSQSAGCAPIKFSRAVSARSGASQVFGLALLILTCTRGSQIGVTGARAICIAGASLIAVIGAFLAFAAYTFVVNGAHTYAIRTHTSIQTSLWTCLASSHLDDSGVCRDGHCPSITRHARQWLGLEARRAHRPSSSGDTGINIKECGKRGGIRCVNREPSNNASDSTSGCIPKGIHITLWRLTDYTQEVGVAEDLKKLLKVGDNQLVNKPCILRAR